MSPEDKNASHASNPSNGQATPHDTETAPDQKPIKAGHGITAAVVLVLVLVVLAIIGILPREHAQSALVNSTNELAAPSVITLTPKPGQPIEELTLPGNVTSYTDAPVYARTAGYLTKWYYDIGAKVQQGALLAEIASPEVDQQLAQAQADLNTAQANASKDPGRPLQGAGGFECGFAAGHRYLCESGCLNCGAGSLGRSQRAAAQGTDFV
jgi:multidrug efflux pump subunit AcrA (membrane-fusion protein)